MGLHEGAVATSGTYERGFHVIDPKRRRPVTDLAAVTVIGPELTLTDAYATAALAMGAAAPAWLISVRRLVPPIPASTRRMRCVGGLWPTLGKTPRRSVR